MYAPMGALLAMRGWVLGGRSNMSGPVSREWEEPISARENDVSAHGDEAMSPPGGGMRAKRHVLRQESNLPDKVQLEMDSVVQKEAQS